MAWREGVDRTASCLYFLQVVAFVSWWLGGWEDDALGEERPPSMDDASSPWGWATGAEGGETACLWGEAGPFQDRDCPTEAGTHCLGDKVFVEVL